MGYEAEKPVELPLGCVAQHRAEALGMESNLGSMVLYYWPQNVAVGVLFVQYLCVTRQLMYLYKVLWTKEGLDPVEYCDIWLKISNTSIYILRSAMKCSYCAQ